MDMSFTSTAITITCPCVPIERRFKNHNEGEHAAPEDIRKERGSRKHSVLQETLMDNVLGAAVSGWDGKDQ